MSPAPFRQAWKGSGPPDNLFRRCTGRKEINMALKMTNREVDGASVLALDGRVVFGAEGDALREELQKLVAEGKKRIVLNMNNI
jgi:hypothetical protein